MALRDWVRLPSRWIEGGGLKHLRWGATGAGANNTAALMVLSPIAHLANDEDGAAKCTYSALETATGLSRAKIAGGLDVLAALGVVERAPQGRSTFRLCNYDRTGGWCKLPARRQYDASGQIMAFKDFHLRTATELHAMRLYYLFAARRGNDTNMANISYDKIEEYSGVDRARIRSAISMLAATGLVHVEHIPSMANQYGTANAYRLAHLDTRVHMGTRGRRMESDAIF